MVMFKYQHPCDDRAFPSWLMWISCILGIYGHCGETDEDVDNEFAPVTNFSLLCGNSGFP